MHDIGNSDDVTQWKGSLLRPLMFSEAGGQMKHSAGCPYKCKGCFKALLASKTYTSDVITQRHNSSPVRQTRVKPKKIDAIAIVNRALCRAQPIFRHVYGDVAVSNNVRPWPVAAWVDVKHT